VHRFIYKDDGGIHMRRVLQSVILLMMLVVSIGIVEAVVAQRVVLTACQLSGSGLCGSTMVASCNAQDVDYSTQGLVSMTFTINGVQYTNYTPISGNTTLGIWQVSVPINDQSPAVTTLDSVSAKISNDFSCSGSLNTGDKTDYPCFITFGTVRSLTTSCTCSMTNFTSCGIDNVQVTTFTAGPGCTSQSSYISYGTCDYCDPQWAPVYTTCQGVNLTGVLGVQTTNPFVGYTVKHYESLNPNCCLQTGLKSDCTKPGDDWTNQTCEMDFISTAGKVAEGTYRDDKIAFMSEAVSNKSTSFVSALDIYNNSINPLMWDFNRDGNTEIAVVQSGQVVIYNVNLTLVGQASAAGFSTWKGAIALAGVTAETNGQVYPTDNTFRVDTIAGSTSYWLDPYVRNGTYSVGIAGIQTKNATHEFFMVYRLNPSGIWYNSVNVDLNASFGESARTGVGVSCYREFCYFMTDQGMLHKIDAGTGVDVSSDTCVNSPLCSPGASRINYTGLIGSVPIIVSPSTSLKVVVVEGVLNVTGSGIRTALSACETTDMTNCDISIMVDNITGIAGGVKGVSGINSYVDVYVSSLSAGVPKISRIPLIVSSGNDFSWSGMTSQQLTASGGTLKCLSNPAAAKCKATGDVYGTAVATTWDASGVASVSIDTSSFILPISAPLKNASQLTNCSRITVSGNYTLGTDLVGSHPGGGTYKACITFVNNGGLDGQGVRNTTLDCQGHMIEGGAISNTTIEVEGDVAPFYAKNITIKNCRILPPIGRGVGSQSALVYSHAIANTNLINNVFDGTAQPGQNLGMLTSSWVPPAIGANTGSESNMNISYNVFYGLYIGTQVGTSNLIIGNKFVQNTYDFRDFAGVSNTVVDNIFYGVGASPRFTVSPAGANIWDNGVHGNEYRSTDGLSSYSDVCTDANADGICDFSYLLFTSNRDNYPLKMLSGGAFTGRYTEYACYSGPSMLKAYGLVVPGASCINKIVTADTDVSGVDRIISGTGVYFGKTLKVERSFSDVENATFPIVADVNSDTRADIILLTSIVLKEILSAPKQSVAFSSTGLMVGNVSCGYNNETGKIEMLANGLAASHQGKYIWMDAKVYNSKGALINELSSDASNDTEVDVPVKVPDTYSGTMTVTDKVSGEVVQTSCSGVVVTITSENVNDSLKRGCMLGNNGADGEFNWASGIPISQYNWYTHYNGLEPVVDGGFATFINAGIQIFHGLSCADNGLVLDVAVQPSLTSETTVAVSALNDGEMNIIMRIVFDGNRVKVGNLTGSDILVTQSLDTTSMNQIRVEMDQELGMGRFIVYVGGVSVASGSLLAPVNGEFSDVMVQHASGTTAFDYIRTSALTGELRDVRNSSTKYDDLALPYLLKCVPPSDRNFTADPAWMSGKDLSSTYANVQLYCEKEHSGKLCSYDDLMKAVRFNGDCYKEAFGYCVMRTYPASVDSGDLSSPSNTVRGGNVGIDGAAACNMALGIGVGSQKVLLPFWNSFWSLIKSAPIMFGVLFFIIVVVLASQSKRR
jgi:hypothetical protein